MADDENDLDETEENGEGEESGKSGSSKKKLLIFGATGIALAAIAGIVAFLFIGGGEEDKKAMIELPGPSVYVEMPSFIADLKTGRCRSPVLKLALSLEIADNDQDRLKEIEPQLLDAIRMRFRDQQRQDLMGKAGAEQLRSDIHTVAANMMAPSEIRGVLFKEFLLQ